MERVWLKHYPAGVKETVNYEAYHSLVELLEEGVTRYAPKDAFRFMGKAWASSLATAWP